MALFEALTFFFTQVDVEKIPESLIRKKLEELKIVFDKSGYFSSRVDSTPSVEYREMHIGPLGQFALGFLDQRKDKPVHPALIHPESYAKTLKAQLAWWLSFILGQDVEAKTEKITATSVKTTFNSDGIENISPLNTGAGNSFVLKLLVLCLTSAPGDLLLLENSEIHLHPGAQSRLGSLMAFLSAKGVQIIAETHCEHLINRIRYEVFKKQILPDDVLIHYKKNIQEPFEILKINHGGHFCDTAGEEKNFPGGFLILH